MRNGEWYYSPDLDGYARVAYVYPKQRWVLLEYFDRAGEIITVEHRKMHEAQKALKPIDKTIQLKLEILRAAR